MPYQIKLLFIFLTVIFTVSGCTKKREPAGVITNAQYYPVRDFILNDYKHMRADHDLTKKIVINGKSSLETLSGPVKPVEIEILEQVYINNPKYAGYYQGDTTYSLAGEIEKINYKATHIDAAIKDIEINFVRGKVQRIYAHATNSSIVSFGRQELEYRTGAGYHLHSLQKVLAKDTLKLDVEASFISRK